MTSLNAWVRWTTDRQPETNRAYKPIISFRNRSIDVLNFMGFIEEDTAPW